MEIRGHCHCKNVRYLLEMANAGNMTLRICRCDFCLRHRPRYWSDPEGSVGFEVEDTEAIVKYRFGHRTAEFILCRRCGVFCGAVTEIAGSRYAVINMNLAQTGDESPAETYIEALDENESQRTGRRAKSWMPVVAWPVSSSFPEPT